MSARGGQQVGFTDVRDFDQFIDDPLPPVTQDNIDIELHVGEEDAFERRDIGETDRPVVAPTDDARSYSIIDAEVELIDGPETNYMQALVVGDGHNIPPSEGDPLNRGDPPEIVTLNVNNQLTEAERDGQQISRIFTGVVANAARMGDHHFKMTAFWPGFNIIQDEKVVLAPPPALFFGTDVVDYQFRRNSVSHFINRVGQRVTGGTPFSWTVNMDRDGVLVGELPDGTEVRNGFDIEVTVDTWREPIEEVLDNMQLKSESIWEVDRYGDFYFGAINPDAHKLRFITETSAGKQSPAWRSVLVIGDGVVSQDGWGASAQINEDAMEVRGNIDGAEVEDGLAEPTFVYRNLEINTREEARHVMEELREEIREQAAGGFIEVVGHPEVWPGDAIELPDAPQQPFALERFGVKRVIHRLNNNDGYTTRIECGGITNASKTVFEDELMDIIEEQKEYEDSREDRQQAAGGAFEL